MAELVFPVHLTKQRGVTLTGELSPHEGNHPAAFLGVCVKRVNKPVGFSESAVHFFLLLTSPQSLLILSTNLEAASLDVYTAPGGAGQRNTFTLKYFSGTLCVYRCSKARKAEEMRFQATDSPQIPIIDAQRILGDGLGV